MKCFDGQAVATGSLLETEAGRAGRPIARRTSRAATADANIKMSLYVSERGRGAVSGVAGAGRQQAGVDARALAKRRPSAVRRRVEQRSRRRPASRTSRGGSSPRRAAPRPSRHSRAPPASAPARCPAAIARSMSSVPVSAQRSPTLSVSSPAQSWLCSTKPRCGSTGPPRWTGASGASPGSMSSSASKPWRPSRGTSRADADAERAVRHRARTSRSPRVRSADRRSPASPADIVRSERLVLPSRHFIEGWHARSTSLAATCSHRSAVARSRARDAASPSPDVSVIVPAYGVAHLRRRDARLAPGAAPRRLGGDRRRRRRARRCRRRARAVQRRSAHPPAADRQSRRRRRAQPRDRPCPRAADRAARRRRPVRARLSRRR